MVAADLLDVKLLDGETICPKCKGNGTDLEHPQYTCPKCSGTRKVDWVSKAMNIPKKRNRSSLDMVNVRSMINYIKTIFEQFVFEPNDEITKNQTTNCINDYLNVLKNKRALYDYKVVCDKSNNYNIDVHIKPSRTMEIITANFQISNFYN